MEDRSLHAFLTGRIEVLDLPLPGPEEHRAPHMVLRRTLYIWQPPAVLVPKLPAGYCVALMADLAPDGVRRFSPVDPENPVASATNDRFFDATAFALLASLGGRALIWARNEESSPCSLFTYEEARLFLSYARHRQQYLGGTRRLARELGICVAGRSGTSDRDVLPADLELDRNGNGTRWNIGRLKEEGRYAAAARGLSNPTEDDIVRLGLVAAAQSNPIEATDEQAEVLVRLALFRLDRTVDPVTEEDLALVAERVKKDITKKLNVTDEEFRSWIEDPKSNLIRAIQRSFGGRLTREQIHYALLELAWRCVKMFAHTLDAQMRAFRDALPEPLSPEEDFLFSQCYLANPVFGGLPMLLLHDRLSFLAEVVQDYWLNSNSDCAVAAVRTMLYYYAAIIGNRRDADRLYQQRRRMGMQATGAIHETTISDEYPQQIVERSPMLDLIQETAVQLLISKGIIPKSRADEWCVEITGSDAELVSVRVYNQDKRVKKAVDLPRREFDARVRELAQSS